MFLCGTRSKEAYQQYNELDALGAFKKRGSQNGEVSVGQMTRYSGCVVRFCFLMHSSTENILTGRRLLLILKKA